MIRQVLGPLGFVVLFNVVAIGVLVMIPPWLGVFWVVLLGAAFLGWHLRAPRESSDRLSRIPIGAPRTALPWVALACISTLLCLFGIAGLIASFGRPLQPEELRGYELLSDYQSTTWGWIAFTLLIALVIPLVEEFNFRGRIQHSLMRKYGVIVALSVTALLFAIMHMGVPRSAILLIPLTLGFANGIAVIVFNSIWPAVATHTLWNGSMAVLGALRADAVPAPDQPNQGARLAVSAVVLGLGALGWWAAARRRLM